ncbi:NAD dependent epimerase/dehydratase family protein [Legionella beliardensis]|uniref:UDP-glucuronate decarboxylase n=1 Tax=Legionella beliardensis TaxID=91822 RepID=A0A378HZ28_9GAMM|nr:UDP-glucuronic acid decarboxylase family protein [Legionella beliardensis]STX28169.1 NAD dependent epimerase/dehydratase family protein [Legionella beliardensis]
MQNATRWTVVTGGAGFIGSHLCRYLLEKQHAVLCIDDLSSGLIDNIISLKHYPQFKFIKHDITCPINLTNIKEIYNLACPAAPHYYLNNSIQTFKTNIYGSMNMLELARNNSAKILQASTSEVYGDPQFHPQLEDYFGNVNPIGPRACYNEGKRAAEALFFDYHRVYKLPIKIIRLFNVYGPQMRQDDGRVISNFIWQALNNNPLTIYGTGTQTRSFCYVSDIVEGLYKVMNTDDHFLGPINLGNPEEISIINLATIINRLLSLEENIVFKPQLQDDPRRRCPDIELAKKVLNWYPRVVFHTGLNKTVDYFKATFKNAIKEPIYFNN